MSTSHNPISLRTILTFPSHIRLASTKGSSLFRFPVGIHRNWAAYNTYSFFVLDGSATLTHTPTEQNFHFNRFVNYVTKLVFSLGSKSILHQNRCFSQSCIWMTVSNLRWILEIAGCVRDWVVNWRLQLPCNLHTHSQIHRNTSKLVRIARMSRERPPFCITLWLMGKHTSPWVRNLSFWLKLTPSVNCTSHYTGAIKKFWFLH